jgi:transcriptional regulator with XRE-family HTH domain
LEQEVTGIGQWLKDVCQKQGLSLRQAAAKTGLSHGTIEGVIKGTSPSPDTIKRLAQSFGENGNEKLALEDSLLILAGYRTQRPDGQDISQPLARLLDKVAHFDEDKLKLMADFAEYLARKEKKR